MSTSSVYEQYFGLDEHPFSITPDPRFVYLSDSHRTALEHLNQGAVGGANGFVLLTGDVGTGKTTICRTFLEQVPPKTEVALILNPVLTLNEFLQTICDELDLVIEGSRESNKNLIDHLNRFLLQVYAVGQKTILIVDEAQNLTHELLEQIRLLTNLETNTDKLLQIFLIGQPELRDMLDRPDMLQVSQRITSRYHLGPLNKAETREYIYKRLDVAGTQDIEFTAGGIRRIYAFTKGVPRLINVLCDKALLSAFESSTNKIGDKIVRDAERRLHGNSELVRGGWFKLAASVGVVVLFAAVILGAGYWTNIADIRSWVDNRMAEVPVVESAGSTVFNVPQKLSLGEEVASPLPGSGTPEKLRGMATRVPSEDIRSSAGAGQLASPNQVASDADMSAPASPASSDPVELADETTPPPFQVDEAQVEPLGGAGNLAAVEIGRSEPSQNLTDTARGDLATSTAGVESAEIQHTPTNETPMGPARRDLLARAESIEPSESERTATSDDLAGGEEQGEPGTGAEGPESADIEHAATPQDQTTSAHSGMVARTESIDPVENERTTVSSGSKRTKQSRTVAGTADTRASAGVEKSMARQSTETRSPGAARPVETLTGYTQKFAERKLLSMWGVAKEPPAGLDFCQGAQRNGLNCLKEGSGLSGLYLYNRPAIISLTVGDLPSYAVVMKATRDNVVLNVLGREHVIPATVLRNVWDGRFLLLWRGSDSFDGNITQGATGRPAIWLRQSIDRIEGKETNGSVYDADLVSRVKQFQSNAGLTPDGIVGPRTFMVLQNKLAQLDKN